MSSNTFLKMCPIRQCPTVFKRGRCRVHPDSTLPEAVQEVGPCVNEIAFALEVPKSSLVARLELAAPPDARRRSCAGVSCSSGQTIFNEERISLDLCEIPLQPNSPVPC